MKFKDGTKLGIKCYEQFSGLHTVGATFVYDKTCCGFDDDFCTECYLMLYLFFVSIEIGRIL